MKNKTDISKDLGALGFITGVAILRGGLWGLRREGLPLPG